MATQIKPGPAGLYHEDCYAWALQQARLLEAKRFREVDLGHPVEEVESLAAGSWSAVRSHARIILEHLLKLQHSPAPEPRNGRRRVVRVQRQRLEDVLTPTLRRDLGAAPKRLYARSRRLVTGTTGDDGEHDAAAVLPETCPHTLDHLQRGRQPACVTARTPRA